MMRKGMIVETDHMSVKARRQTLTILESTNYPGVISSHSWGDLGQPEAHRSSSAGSSARSPAWPPSSPTSGASPGPTATRTSSSGRRFGSDINGLHAQPVPRPGAAQNPVNYPFRSFDGGSLIHQQHSGTRVYDVNTDGVDHYGLYPDWIEDLRMVAGTADRGRHGQRRRGYLQLWARAQAAAG